MDINKKFKSESGFTLIEIIASLVILGLLGGTISVLILGRVVDAFYLTKTNAETAQKGQIALNRLTNEFTNIITVNSADSISINFTSRSYVDGTLQAGRNVSLVNNTLFIDGDILVDNVSSFVLTYYDDFSSSGSTSWSPTTSKVIEFTLSLVGANNTVSVFTGRVVPRNL
jgi:prepilin-type N-terminal cleavage/methylation domain-containing protein